MYIEFGKAQQFIDELSINAKRGMKTKAEMGWWPQHAPLGYVNTPEKTKGMRVILKDKNRFHIVQQCFREVASGTNAKKVFQKATQEWGLNNINTGKPIALSTFYKMLNNPFYYGDYCWN